MTKGAQSVSAAALSSSSVAVVGAASAGAKRAPAIERGECEAIRLLRLVVEYSFAFLSDFEAEQCGVRGGKEGFEGAENFVRARRRAARLLASWSLPVGKRPMPMRRYTYAQLREVARLHAEGLSTTAIARGTGMTHWSVHYHLGPSGSMIAAMLDSEVSDLCQCGEASLPIESVERPRPSASESVNEPVGVSRAQKAKGGAA